MYFGLCFVTFLVPFLSHSASGHLPANPLPRIRRQKEVAHHPVAPSAGLVLTTHRPQVKRNENHPRLVSYSPPLLPGHRPLTTACQRLLSLAAFPMVGRPIPGSLTFASRSLLPLFLGLPRHCFPGGVQVRACPVMLLVAFLPLGTAKPPPSPPQDLPFHRSLVCALPEICI